MAVGVREVEPLPAGKAAHRLAYDSTCSDDPVLDIVKLMVVQDQQGPAGTDLFAAAEPTGEPAIIELAVSWAEIGEGPAEQTAVEVFASFDVADTELDIVDPDHHTVPLPPFPIRS